MKELEHFITTHESNWNKELRHKKVGMMKRFNDYLYLEKIEHLNEFNKVHGDEFLEKLQTKYSQSFCQTVYYFIKSVFDYYVEQGQLILNPMESIPVPKVAHKENRQTIELKLQSKLKKTKCLTASERLILILYMDFGMLESHIVSLKVSDINLQTGMLFVKLKKTAYRLEPRIKQQFIQILSERSLLMPKCDEVFLGKDKKPLTAQYVGALVRRVLDAS